MVAAWRPMNGVKRALVRRKKNSKIAVKMKIMVMSPNWSKNIGRFVGPATKIWKKPMVPAAKITMRIRKAVSFLSELKMPGKDILPLHYW
jgi:hypothetical protein